MKPAKNKLKKDEVRSILADSWKEIFKNPFIFGHDRFASSTKEKFSELTSLYCSDDKEKRFFEEENFKFFKKIKKGKPLFNLAGGRVNLEVLTSFFSSFYGQNAEFFEYLQQQGFKKLRFYPPQEIDNMMKAGKINPKTDEDLIEMTGISELANRAREAYLRGSGQGAGADFASQAGGRDHQNDIDFEDIVRVVAQQAGQAARQQTLQAAAEAPRAAPRAADSRAPAPRAASPARLPAAPASQAAAAQGGATVSRPTSSPALPPAAQERAAPAHSQVASPENRPNRAETQDPPNAVAALQRTRRNTDELIRRARQLLNGDSRNTRF